MKAILVRRYGPPDSITLADLPTPVPGPGELLIRIRAATVSAADMRLRAGRFPRGMGLLARLALGITGPRKAILGTDLAGEVTATGPGVTGWAPGDAVIAFVGAQMGCHAQYRCLPQTAALVAKPAGLDWPQAAAIAFGGSTALWYLRDRARLKPGESLLVIGASGAVGAAAVQIGHRLGARVTGVCSAANTGLVTSLGASAVIDYQRQDWSSAGQSWDVILDTTGTVTAAMARPCLTAGGRLALVAADLPQMLAAPLTRGIRVLIGPAPERRADLQTLADWAASGEVIPHVSLTLPLDQAARAHAMAESGRKRGNIMLMP